MSHEKDGKDGRGRRDGRGYAEGKDRMSEAPTFLPTIRQVRYRPAVYATLLIPSLNNPYTHLYTHLIHTSIHTLYTPLYTPYNTH